MRWWGGVAVAALTLQPVSVAAQMAPMPGPGEERAAGLLMQAQSKMNNDPTEGRALLEEARLLAPNPTPFRGMIECMRGTAMRDMPEMDSQAREAFAECRRLLPDNPMAKTYHAYFLLYHDLGNEKDLLQGVDLLLEVMEQDKQIGNQLPGSQFIALIRRLGYVGDDARIARLTEAMLKQGFLTSPTENNDYLILTGVVAALKQGNADLASQFVPMLKHGRSLDILSASLVAKPIWDAVADYRKGGLAYRQADYDRSTKIAFEAEPETGLAARIDALVAIGRPQEIHALIMDHLNAAWLADKDLSDLESGVATATRELANAGLTQEALDVGKLYLERLGDDGIEDALNFSYNHGFRLIEHGRRSEGLAVLEKARQAWERDTSTTEGKGGELNAIALKSCDTRATRANNAFAQLLPQKAINPKAYEIALRCRNDVPALAAYLIEQMDGPVKIESLSSAAGLRLLEAGLYQGGSVTDKALLARPDVRSALDRVSVPLAHSLP